MKGQITIVNGKQVAHKYVIYHNTISQFGFWDRVKILLGKKVMIHSEIFTMNDECNVVATRVATSVGVLFSTKSKGMEELKAITNERN